jgi:cold shock CspA family protein
MKGVIRTFVPENQLGFIKGDDGKDYFFHRRSFKAQRDKDNICDDALVDFEPVPTPKGYRAQNCSLIDSSDVTTYIVPDEFLTSKES